MQAKLTSVFRKMGAVQDWLPRLGRHVTARVVHMEDKRFLIAFRLTGVAFEASSDALLENLFDNLSGFIARLGVNVGSDLAIWTTFQRHKVSFGQAYRFDSTFLRDFAAKYLKRFESGEYYENAFYISLVLKYEDFDDGLRAIEQLGEEAFNSLRPYDPEYLEAWNRNGIQFSNVYRFLGQLVNGTSADVPVTAAPAVELIPQSWLHFGYDVLQIRSDVGTRYATCFDLKDFPECGHGQLDHLLTLPVEFTITQSFGCMTPFAANKAITTQINKLASVGDKAKHQVKDLELAQGYVSAGELVFGDYHGALIVYGDTAKQAIAHGESVKVHSAGQCGVVWNKATLSAPWTYFSQIPGAKTKPRPQPKSSRNLAATFTLHDYSSGKSTGNPIGDGSAVIPLETASKRLYCFNYHATRDDEMTTGERVAGHALFLGSTGVGKTTIQLAVLAFFMRFNPMLFGLDVGRGMQIFFRALRGTYIVLEKGVPTGLAPFELEDTLQNRQFLYEIVGICGRNHEGRLTATEELQVKVAVDTVMGLELEQRYFSRLLESIPNTGDDCLHVRLSRWCRASDGPYAWVFDNPPGSMVDVTKLQRVCFDVTDFLQNGYEPSEAVFTYLFYLKKLMQREGALMATIVEEFWLPLKFRMTREMMEKVLAAGRKEGEFLVLVSQQPEQVLGSELFPLVRSQTATKVLLPDPEAEYEDAYQKLNITQKEFRVFKALSKTSRRFLIKQSNQSAFASLDLVGFEDEIVVLSGNRENVLLMESIIAEVGTDDPDVWLPILQDRVFENRTKHKLITRHGPDPAVWTPLLKTEMQERRARREALRAEASRYERDLIAA
ncbi:VirB4 family type IV secretion system protein [Burkholderia pseudomallei]|uniref:VirB4 family type IV secretion system protein n=1 Tax=Burkholderia pseudomallei TaxID=28450 RepID=UPI000536C71C|nr:VirB4 family type IV secretion system protein [Burkholderia pseudomallei]KGW12220.1 cagE, TrbE, VirB, component of type IV transporter system family protein [Burkholderia pseudomallei MSHR4000]